MVGIDGKGIYVSSGVKSILDFSPRTHLGPFFHLPAQWHTAHWKLEQLFQDKLLLFEETLQNNCRKMSKRRGECVIQPPSERWVRLQVTCGRAHVFPCCKRANGYRDSIWIFFFLNLYKRFHLSTSSSCTQLSQDTPPAPKSQRAQLVPSASQSVRWDCCRGSEGDEGFGSRSASLLFLLLRRLAHCDEAAAFGGVRRGGAAVFEDAESLV